MHAVTRYIVALTVVVLTLLSLHTTARADHNQHLFETANKFFEEKKFSDAIAAYQEILKNGYESWQVYYNLGNAYYKTGQNGRAILNYERAMRMNPESEDLLFNLELANLTVVDKVVTPPRFLLDEIVPVLKSLQLWNVGTLGWYVISFYFVMTVLIILKIFSRGAGAYSFLNVALTIIVVVLIIVSSLFFIRLHDETSSRYAIVLEKKVDVMGSPDEQGTDLFSLHEGVKIKVEAFNNQWAKIRLADGKIGWLKLNLFEII
ncbi:MAG: tetratricopeptide repeat protein [Candidatus Zhuqueibacterota bacterium]